MRVCDAQDSVYNGLCGMEWYRYLRAMWMIGGYFHDADEAVWRPRGRWREFTHIAGPEKGT
jgi:hypothetical protein